MAHGFRRRSRLALQFDPLESRTLLSTGAAEPLPQVPRELRPDNSLIVRFIDQATADDQSAALARVGARLAQTHQSRSTVIAFDPGTDLEAMSRQLGQDPAVRYVEPNRWIHLEQTPNDASYNQLWALRSSSPVAINAPAAWDLTTGASSVTVAVTDTGIDYNHLDLYLNIAVNQSELPSALRSQVVDTNGDGLIDFYDFNSLNAARQVVAAAGQPVNSGRVADTNNDGRISGSDLLADSRWADGLDQDGNGQIDDLVGMRFTESSVTNRPTDDHGHGTHVAGTIGAIGNNAVGVVGVNWNVRLLPLKFIAASGEGTLADAILSIEYAADQAARVINASWGDSGTSAALQDAISYAGTRGAVFVSAAGNASANIDQSPFIPASIRLPNTLAVAALQSDGSLASYSNYGANSVDLAAPGSSILSTTPGNQYGYKSGTSMAAPHVAGAAALLLSRNPQWTASQTVEWLRTTARPTPSVATRVITGGSLDVGAAVSSAPIIDPVRIVDDGDAGWADAGFSRKSGLGGHAGDSRYSFPTDPAAWATWTFSVTPGQTYQLAAAWSHHANRATNAPFEILIDGVTTRQLSVNQQLAPNDFTAGGTAWERLGPALTATGSTLVVRLTNAANGVVIADAVRLEAVAGSAGLALSSAPIQASGGRRPPATGDLTSAVDSVLARSLPLGRRPGSPIIDGSLIPSTAILEPFEARSLLQRRRSAVRTP